MPASTTSPAPAPGAPAGTVLSVADWSAQAQAHEARADDLTAGRRERVSRGERHAIEDFLFDYYALKPRHLRIWHPGVGIALEADDAWGDRRWYGTRNGVTALDREAYLTARLTAVRYVRALVTATMGRRPVFGCFGMHEWAMVYRAADDLRHPLPLRLGQDGTDAAVEANPLVCTHFDAFRFFTPPAAPRNTHGLTRENQVDMEQPGCLHATMDLFKWTLKLGPAAPGDLLLDAFTLARDVRYVDMQASPYDVSSYGLAAIAVETPEGKAEYAKRQREFAARATPLRERLLAVCEALLD
ncbi:3-methyladenine DNA glycosylase [Demequina sp.]|uniref:3-methyladenine DNA glycosylase n=1 Tax=Demequina sp. TaxID=2050685 RepID=UPI003A84B4ED